MSLRHKIIVLNTLRYDQKYMFLSMLFFLTVALVISGLFVYKHMCIFFASYMKNVMGIWMCIALNLMIIFGSIVTFTKLILPVQSMTGLSITYCLLLQHLQVFLVDFFLLYLFSYKRHFLDAIVSDLFFFYSLPMRFLLVYLIATAF